MLYCKYNSPFSKKRQGLHQKLCFPEKFVNSRLFSVIEKNPFTRLDPSRQKLPIFIYNRTFIFQRGMDARRMSCCNERTERRFSKKSSSLKTLIVRRFVGLSVDIFSSPYISVHGFLVYVIYGYIFKYEKAVKIFSFHYTVYFAFVGFHCLRNITSIISIL